MSKHFATTRWVRQASEPYTDNQYSRGHQWSFDGGAIIQASSSPHVVPLPHSIEANVDPEEAFIASISSCHMLFFLSIAAKKKYVVDAYTDKAVGVMQQNDKGQIAMTTVTLKPLVKFSGDKRPSKLQLEKLHHLSHQQCFIANSVKTEIITEIIFDE